MDHNPGLTDAEDVALYLNRDLHKRKDRKATLPYEIIRDEVVGRHMVASRDVRAGEVIFEEMPLTFGPSDNSQPVCLGCYQRITVASDCVECVGGCGYPMCSESCGGVREHKEFECAAFREKGYKLDRSKLAYENSQGEDSFTVSRYAIISPIRALKLRKSDPARWNLLWSHMSHHESRRKSKYWRERTQRVIKDISEAIVLTDEDALVLEIVLGILLVNSFEISIYDREQEIRSSTDSSIQGLFALASMPSHSCVANATHDFSTLKTGYRMTMRAVVRIGKGEEITHSYTEPLDPVLFRRTLLQVGKFFQCACVRCADATELGTYSSAVACTECGKGFLVSSDTSNIESRWNCNACDSSFSCERVQAVYQGAKKVAVDWLSPPDGPVASIGDHEKFLKKYSGRILHPNHVIIVDVKYTLAKMYGRVGGYEADSLSDEQFRRKRQLCEDVLAVLNKIIPGRMRKRGMMMYELHLPLVMLANRQLQGGPNTPGINRGEIKDNLKKGLFNLRMGLEILKDEPEDTFERKIVEGSKDSVEQLEGWVKTVCESI